MKPIGFNPLNAESNPIRHLLALVRARHIVHVSRVRVVRSKKITSGKSVCLSTAALLTAGGYIKERTLHTYTVNKDKFEKIVPCLTLRVRSNPLIF